MPSTTIQRGNALFDTLIAPTITWSGSVGATSTAELTATIPGFQVGDVISGTSIGAALTTGLSYTNWRVSAPNTIAVTWVNTTAGALTPQSGPWNIEVMRPENPSNIPANLG